MRWQPAMVWLLPLLLCSSALRAQSTDNPSVARTEAPADPLPDPKALLADVEQNQKRIEALQRDYTYHVHSEEQELGKHGEVKKTQTEDAESLTIDGVRVNRITARNGKPLTPEEQGKESERLDKEVAKAKERRAKVASQGHDTDARGNEIMPLSRILELGSFSNPRREMENNRPVIVLDYAGNPQAKTHSAFEGIMRDVIGTLRIDEKDRVLIAAQGSFLNDFKLGAGLLADVRKGTHFEFRTIRVGDGVWLPADISGQGAVRILLFANFNGRMHVTTSDYKRFRTSSKIVGTHGVIEPGAESAPGTQPPNDSPAGPQPHDDMRTPRP